MATKRLITGWYRKHLRGRVLPPPHNFGRANLPATAALLVISLNANLLMAQPEHLSLNGPWQVAITGSEEWLPATVPGCVQTDLLAAGRIPDPFFRDNEERALGGANQLDVLPDLLRAKALLARIGCCCVAKGRHAATVRITARRLRRRTICFAPGVRGEEPAQGREQFH